jgi:hypothetical protein
MSNPVTSFFTNLWGSDTQPQQAETQQANPQQELTDALKTIAQNSTDVLNSDPEYVSRKETEKLTESDVISKLGLPIYKNEELGADFVHPDALKAYNENFLKPNTQQLEVAIANQNDYIARQQASAATVEIYDQLSRNFPSEIELYGKGLPIESVIGVLNNPRYAEGLKEIMKSSESEAVKVALQIARSELESASKLNQAYDSYVPQQQNAQVDDGGIEVPSSGNRYQRNASGQTDLSSYKNGDIIALVVPDIVQYGSPEYAAALKKYEELTKFSENVFSESGKRKLISIELVKESEKDNLRTRSSDNKVHYRSLR